MQEAKNNGHVRMDAMKYKIYSNNDIIVFHAYQFKKYEDVIQIHLVMLLGLIGMKYNNIII